MQPAVDCTIVRFSLWPNPRFLRHLAQYPDDPTRKPSVRAAIVRGSLEDGLFVVGRHIAPNLAFELFTVEHSQLLADGCIDPSFRSFGLAWYHGILEANENGVLSGNVRAMLLDLFGFDAKMRPTPIGAFHIGLWFRDLPSVAADGAAEDLGSGEIGPRAQMSNVPSAFGAAHGGGPLAMISVPVVATGLGPLYTQPSARADLANDLL